MSRRTTRSAVVAATILAATFAGTVSAQASAELADLEVRGAKTSKQGATKTYRVTVLNVGDTAAEGVKVVASGGGKGNAAGGTVAPGASKVVRVKVKITGKAGRTVTVRFKATTATGASASGRIKVTVAKKKSNSPSGSPDFPLYPPPQLPSVGGG